MLVYVLNQRGKALMPCKPAKARHLLKQGKAKVVKRTPFTIQLLYGSSGYKQPITLGVDSGYEHIGLSAVADKRELFSAETQLRTDVSKLLTERRMYRRNRRFRKTRYRKCRFLNRVAKFKQSPLAPSIQHKLDSHLRIINRVASILPISKIVVETANFDIQQIKNPTIKTKEYQRGEQFGFNNVKAYVLHRDNYKCQHCMGKSKDLKLNVHHIVLRSKGGTDKPDNLITLCKTCHDKLHLGSIILKIKPKKHFKAETFMSTVRQKLISSLRTIYGDVEETWGYITKTIREQLGLVKSHIDDAFIIAGGTNQTRSKIDYFVKQVRKQNRKLFKGTRSHIKNTADRVLFGFQRWDKVMFNNKECFVYGRRSSGYFDVRLLNGTEIHSSVKYSKLKLLESFGTFLWAPIHPSAKAEGLLGEEG